MEETSLKLTVGASEAMKNLAEFTESANAAANAVERLDKAWASLAETLKTLNGSPHGGITFQMVADVAQAEIKHPPCQFPPITPDNARGAKAFLDGIYVEGAAACDPDLGYVLVLPTPGKEFVPVEFNGAVYEKLYGVVTIVMP